MVPPTPNPPSPTPHPQTRNPNVNPQTLSVKPQPPTPNPQRRGSKLIATGLSMAIPSGFYGRVAPRSGLAVKKSIHVGAGVVDPDYRSPFDTP